MGVGADDAIDGMAKAYLVRIPSFNLTYCQYLTVQVLYLPYVTTVCGHEYLPSFISDLAPPPCFP